jgi:AcrR family transcriptional regulator
MPASDCDIRDPRIKRTRRLLQGALSSLMQSKSFDEISVQDITEAATVNRATFYDHYTDKFALLDAMVAGGFHALLQQRNVRYDGTCHSAASAIILAACDYLSQCSSPEVHAKQVSFGPLIEAAVAHAIRRVLLEGMGKKGAGLPPEIAASSVSWAILGAVKQWAETPKHRSAEETVPLILQLILPMLQAADPVRANAPVREGEAKIAFP